MKKSLDKDSFDVALIAGARAQLRQQYMDLRTAESETYMQVLDEQGKFLDGTAYTRGCPLCNAPGEKSDIKYETRGMRIVRCADCGFIYSREVLHKNAELARYQASPALISHQRIRQDSCYAELETNKARYILNQASRFAVQAGKMLDIGCSNGVLLGLAAETGMLPHGIEISADLAEQARQRGFAVTQGVFPDDLPDDWREFGMITMLDVLEHAANPLEFLASVAERLSYGAVVAVQVPNFNSLIVRLEGAVNSNFCHGHWSYFQPETLIGMMLQAGFSCLHTETLITELDRISAYGFGEIQAAVLEICGDRLADKSLITTDYLHQRMLGYKLFGVFRLQHRT